MNPRHVSAELVLPNELTEVRPVQDGIEAALQANQWGDSDVFAIKLAVEEALVNAIKHGNQFDPEKKVQVKYLITDERFEIEIEDEGAGFNPADVPDPTEIGYEDRPCGRGVFLIKNFMTSVEYRGRGNAMAMSKIKSPDEPPSE